MIKSRSLPSFSMIKSRSLPPLAGDKGAGDIKSSKQINTSTVAGDKGAGDIKSSKQINKGTVAGDKETADEGVDCDLFICLLGGKRLESYEVKYGGGKTWTFYSCPEEPISGTPFGTGASLVYPQEQFYAKQKYYELGVSKCGLEATKEEKASGGVDKKPCFSCGGKWHRPLPFGIEPPRAPIPDPQSYVACECCLGHKFEEDTGDCAQCGSTLKELFPEYCPLCFETSHFDNNDKECKYYGKEGAKPFNYRGIKIRRQPRISRKKLGKKLAKKQKELAAEYTVVPDLFVGAGDADA